MTSETPRVPIRPGTARRLGLDLPVPDLTIHIAPDLSRLTAAVRLLPTQAQLNAVAKRITDALRPGDTELVIHKRAGGYGIQEDT